MLLHIVILYICIEVRPCLNPTAARVMERERSPDPEGDWRCMVHLHPPFVVAGVLVP